MASKRLWPFYSIVLFCPNDEVSQNENISRFCEDGPQRSKHLTTHFRNQALSFYQDCRESYSGKNDKWIACNATSTSAHCHSRTFLPSRVSEATVSCVLGFKFHLVNEGDLLSPFIFYLSFPKTEVEWGRHCLQFAVWSGERICWGIHTLLCEAVNWSKMDFWINLIRMTSWKLWRRPSRFVFQARTPWGALACPCMQLLDKKRSDVKMVFEINFARTTSWILWPSLATSQDCNFSSPVSSVHALGSIAVVGSGHKKLSNLKNGFWGQLHENDIPDTLTKASCISLHAATPSCVSGAYALGSIDPSLYKMADVDDDYEFPDDHVGRIWFAVEYELETEKLTVTLIKAKNLPSRVLGNTNGCDPFVRSVRTTWQSGGQPTPLSSKG